MNLKLQYLGHLMGRANSLEKTLMLGKIEGKRRRGKKRMRLLDGITNLMDMSLSKLWEMMSPASQVMGALDLPHHPLQCSCLENPRDGGAW